MAMRHEQDIPSSRWAPVPGPHRRVRRPQPAASPPGAPWVQMVQSGTLCTLSQAM